MRVRFWVEDRTAVVVSGERARFASALAGGPSGWFMVEKDLALIGPELERVLRGGRGSIYVVAQIFSMQK